MFMYVVSRRGCRLRDPQRAGAGAPEMTYGRSLNKALEKFGVDPRRWPELAADRGAWRRMLHDGFPPDAFRPRPPSPPPPPPPATTTRRRW